MRHIICASLIAVLAWAHAAEANSQRLTVVNESLEPVVGMQSTFPLYLSRLGTYFAELYLETDAKGSSDAVAPLDVSLLVSFTNGDKNVFEREIAVKFNPNKRVATLFYVDTPFDLPQRQDLEMKVTLLELDRAIDETATDIRIQLTRKPQLLPFMR